MSFQENAKSCEPPDGLGYSSLRPVRLTGQGIALTVLAIVFLIGAPVLSVVIATQSKKAEEQQRLLRDQGAAATAVITRVWRTDGKDSRHMVSYRFDRGDGKVSAPKRIWEGLAAGAPLAIRYVPARPEINHPSEWEASRPPFLLAYVIIVPMLIPPVLLTIVIRKQIRLLSEGRPAPGVVTSIKRTAKAIIIKYNFTLLRGAVTKVSLVVLSRTPAVGV